MLFKYNQLSHSFLFHMDSIEQLQTSWAEWRYWDNPDYALMLTMGGEMF